MANGLDENGKQLTDRELLIKNTDRLEQIMPTLDRLDVAIRGDGTTENPGILTMCRVHQEQFRQHLADHKKTTRRLYALATALGGGGGLVVDLLHRLHIL